MCTHSVQRTTIYKISVPVQFPHAVEGKGGELSSLVNTCEQQFHSLVDYFCVAPPSGQSSVNPGYFFGLWSSFVVQFNEYWKQEKKNLARERWISRYRFIRTRDTCIFL